MPYKLGLLLKTATEKSQYLKMKIVPKDTEKAIRKGNKLCSIGLHNMKAQQILRNDILGMLVVKLRVRTFDGALYA